VPVVPLAPVAPLVPVGPLGPVEEPVGPVALVGPKAIEKELPPAASGEGCAKVRWLGESPGNVLLRSTIIP
jgi:hypothetical protein